MTRSRVATCLSRMSGLADLVPNRINLCAHSAGKYGWRCITSDLEDGSRRLEVAFEHVCCSVPEEIVGGILFARTDDLLVAQHPSRMLISVPEETPAHYEAGDSFA